MNKARYNDAKTECPRGEIGRHKVLKSPGIHKLHCLRQSQVVSKHYQF